MKEILDLFIIDTEKDLPQVAVWDTFDEYNLLGDIYNVKNNTQINYTEKRNPYYFILYDSENIQEELTVSLRAFCEADFDVVKVYKREKEDKFSIQPRLFKSSIVLPEFGLLPKNWKDLKMETCLNGFLLSF